MNLLGILTLVAVGLIVLALAFYLVAIMILLRKTLFTLGTVNVGVRSIARRVEPLQPILTEINRDLSGVRDRLETVLQRPRQEAS
ncbi:MAG: hypothetical protein H0V77_04760 [Actinobacteria bacterium]|nr:hypothetical protein [Actinomycetota bacterium]